MTQPPITTAAPTQWSNYLETLRGEYETLPAKGIAHGLQKDAIQNGWGARVNNHNWSFEFTMVRTKSGKLILTMTDAGTHGLTGPIYDLRTELPEQFPYDHRLIRFECNFDSGGAIGPGKFGRGKSLFNVSSNEKLVYYDSLTDEKYVMGMRCFVGRSIQQYTHALEGEEAKKQISEVTEGALQPLQQVGTRISIVNPTQEVIEAIEDGSFLKAIEETWWEIIQKYDVKITVKDLSGRTFTAKIPEEISSIPTTDGEKGWRVFQQDLSDVEIDGATYKIKHLVYAVPPEGFAVSPDLLGICVHRRGMKVGNIRGLRIPDEIAERLFGYVQLNPDFEDILANAENDTHYGFDKPRNHAFTALRDALQRQLEAFKIVLGLGDRQADTEAKDKEMLDEATDDFNRLLDGLGIPGLGTGTRSPPSIDLNVKDLVFPGGSNYLAPGTTIGGFWYRVTNKKKATVSAFFEVFTRVVGGTNVETLIKSTKINVDGGGDYDSQKLSITVHPILYPSGKKAVCTAVVKDEKGAVLGEKSFTMYVDMLPQPTKEFASIVLTSASWPNKDSYRVNFGQAIKDLVYEIENLTPLTMKTSVKVGTLWKKERGERIETVFEKEVRLNAFEKERVSVPDIPITKEKYSEMDKEDLILRCHATALEETSDWEKGKKLATNNITFYLNKDKDYGFFEDRTMYDGGPDDPRSIAEPLESNTRWRLKVNKTHPAFINALEDAQMEKDYCVEEMIRQSVYILLLRGEGKIMSDLAKTTINIDEANAPHELLQSLIYPATDKMLSRYYQRR